MSSTTKTAVVGATGQIGSQVVERLTASGHEVVAVSRSSGVDVTTGDGLDTALDGADVVIDVLNSPSMEDGAALAFFTDASANLVAAAQKSGVSHYVLLSIVGVDGLDGGGYLRGKVVQEQTVAQSGVPYTIVRATQFHEFTELIIGSLIVGSEVRVPDALIQPIAAAEVCDVVARVANEAPRNGVLNLGGPEKLTFAELASTVLVAQGKDIPVVVDPSATYFGTPVRDTTMVTPDGAELANTRLADWLAARQ